MRAEQQLKRSTRLREEVMETHERLRTVKILSSKNTKVTGGSIASNNILCTLVGRDNCRNVRSGMRGKTLSLLQISDRHTPLYSARHSYQLPRNSTLSSIQYR